MSSSDDQLAPDGTPWVTSELQRAARLYGGDDFFLERVKFAAALRGVPCSDEVMHRVCMACAPQARASQAGTVDSSGVSDDTILSALDEILTAQSAGADVEVTP